MVLSRPRAAYRVLRDQLLPELTGRPPRGAADAPRPRFSRPSTREPGSHLAIVLGHFTFNDWDATFGDTDAMRVVLDWLSEAQIPFDVACHPDNGFDGVDFEQVDPDEYTIVVFVCGPWDDYHHSVYFERFAHCVRIGVNLSIVRTRGTDFDLLFARDLADRHSPDIVLSAPPAAELPLAGLFLVHEQPEYRGLQRHGDVDAAVRDYLARGEVVHVPLDTVHVGNQTSTRTSQQLQSVLRRLDLVVTTRLHGFVFSLRSGTPPIAIDPIVGGGKVTAQARAVGWPVLIRAEEVTADRIAEAVERCLEEGSEALLRSSVATGLGGVGRVRSEFLDAVTALPAPDTAAPVR